MYRLTASNHCRQKRYAHLTRARGIHTDGCGRSQERMANLLCLQLLLPLVVLLLLLLPPASHKKSRNAPITSSYGRRQHQQSHSHFSGSFVPSSSCNSHKLCSFAGQNAFGPVSKATNSIVTTNSFRSWHRLLSEKSLPFCPSKAVQRPEERDRERGAQITVIGLTAECVCLCLRIWSRGS